MCRGTPQRLDDDPACLVCLSVDLKRPGPLGDETEKRLVLRIKPLVLQSQL